MTMYNLIQFFTLLFVLTEGVYSEQCNDCVSYYLCPNAVNIIRHNRTDPNIQLLRSALCGFDGNRKTATPKVCCSVLSIISNQEEIPKISEDERIANHKNLELLPADCGNIQSNRLLGGDGAELYEFPWMALIAYDTRNSIKFLCGGSIINKRYILTAAQCVQNRNIAGVRVGEYDLSFNIDCQNSVCENHIQDIPVAKYMIHDDYNAHSGINDVALLRLQEDIDFSHKNVHRICLPTTTELRHQVLSHKIATVSGWGLNGRTIVTSIPRKFDVPILTPQYCSNIYNGYYKSADLDVTTNQLCARVPRTYSCQGDAGGPLILEQKYDNVSRYVQYGIVSHGPVSCKSDEPGVYVDVTKYMGWILDNISN